MYLSTAIPPCSASARGTEEPYALAFAKGNEELVEKINASLKTLIDNGSVEKIFTDFGETYVKPE